MKSLRPSRAERAIIGAREDYVIDMLFQLARMSAQDGDFEASDRIKIAWEALQRRATDRLGHINRQAG